MWTYILGPFLAVLPERWRALWFAHLPVVWPRAVLISGFAEAMICMLLLGGWYLSNIQELVNQQAGVAVEAMSKAKSTQGLSNVGVAYSMGLGGLIVFLLHPVTWLLAFGSVEGVWRGFAALVNDEAPGSAVLGLVNRTHLRWQKKSYEKRVPLIEDRLVRSQVGPSQPDWDLRVEACRPKPSWRSPQIIGLKDEYFRVLRETTDDQAQWRRDGVPVRPHVYFLKKIAAGEAYLGSEEYDPKDVLKPGDPGLGKIALDAFKDGLRIQTLPLMPDDVKRDMHGADVFLMIESCRPKEGWTAGRTLNYENCYYRIESSYESKAPRPWGHKLRLLRMGVPGRAVILYDPNEVMRSAQ